MERSAAGVSGGGGGSGRGGDGMMWVLLLLAILVLMELKRLSSTGRTDVFKWYTVQDETSVTGDLSIMLKKRDLLQPQSLLWEEGKRKNDRKLRHVASGRAKKNKA